ncbi:MAG: hypothetical protein ACI9DG_002381 [Oleispira sp.]|jgi:hypothetical protein
MLYYINMYLKEWFLILITNKLLSYTGLFMLLCGIMMTAGFAGFKEGNAKPPSVAVDINEEQYRTVEWTDLMPQDDLDAIMDSPDYLDDIADGSAEDQIGSEVQKATNARDSRYQQALKSTRVVAKFNNQLVRIPGFVVPLEFDDEQTITQFFLVPYFGACIHMPPPPPNQLIYVSYPEGLKLEALYDPFWVTGLLKTSLVENETAISAYAIDVNSIMPYTD